MHQSKANQSKPKQSQPIQSKPKTSPAQQNKTSKPKISPAQQSITNPHHLLLATPARAYYSEIVSYLTPSSRQSFARYASWDIQLPPGDPRRHAALLSRQAR
jgi:hypothetical protein